MPQPLLLSKRRSQMAARWFVVVAAGATASVGTAAEAVGFSTTDCTLEAVTSSSTSEALNSILVGCDDDQVWRAALGALYRLPLPPAPKLTLAPRAQPGASQRVRYDLEVFFDVQVPYPHKTAFLKLDDVLRLLEATYVIESVEVTGSVDRKERQTGIASALASRRARSVAEYLQSAVGKDNMPVVVTVMEPVHENTDEGRARDRRAVVKVTALRAKERAVQSPALPNG